MISWIFLAEVGDRKREAEVGDSVMSADINNYFNKLERALRKLSIIVIDDFDEIKRGNPLPVVALMRKLLFSTSTVVMKQLLLRGCASHISDRKVVVSAFDLLRDTLRHSSPISVDQFFSMVTPTAH